MAKVRRGIEVEVTLAAARYFAEMTRLGRWTRNFLGSYVVAYLSNQLAALGREAIQVGIEFNKVMETSRVGVAAILRQYRPEQFGRVEDALGIAAERMEEIRIEAMATVDTIQDLAQAYKNLSGLMFMANIPMDKQVRFIRVMSNAVRGMGLGARGQQVFQLIEETRALLTGQITRYSVIGQMIFPPGAARDELKAAIEAGTAFDLITEKLSAFEEAGILMAQTYEGLASNLYDAYSDLMGFATEPAFQDIKVFMQDLMNFLKKPEIRDYLRDIFEALSKFLQEVARWGMPAVESLAEVHKADVDLPWKQRAVAWVAGWFKNAAEDVLFTGIRDALTPQPKGRGPATTGPGTPGGTGALLGWGLLYQFGPMAAMELQRQRALMALAPYFGQPGAALGASAKRGLYAAPGMKAYVDKSFQVQLRIADTLSKILDVNTDTNKKI